MPGRYVREACVYPGQEEACLGAAIIAGAGVGMFKDLQKASIQMVETHARFDPDTKNTKKYDTIYQKYVELYENLCPFFQKEGEV